MRRAVSGLLAGAVLTAALALAGPAAAGYKAKVAGGTLTLTGNAKGDRLALRLKKNAAGTLQVDVGANGSVEFSFRRSRFTAIVVNAGGSHDTVTIDERRGVFTTTEATTLNGGAGNDRLNGGTGGETLDGGPGKDVLNGKGGADTARGGPGADTVSLGGGDDSAVSLLGGGADVVTGGPGTDLFRMAGTSGGDALAARAEGAAARVTRNVDNASVRVATVERLELDAGVGADDVTVSDLTDSGVTHVEVELGTGGAGDGADDRVFVEGGSMPDVLTAAAVMSMVQVTGGAAQVDVLGAEPALDRLNLAGLGGNDTLSGSALASLVMLTLDGGTGNDVLNGGNGADLLLGGSDNDTIDGNQGADVALAGEGNDSFVWDPGDGSDVVEGQEGDDTLVFNGSAGAEIFTAAANGGRLLFTRNVGNIVMDTDGVEALVVNALGGTDSITVNSLGATDVTNVTTDLGAGGASDGAADTVTMNTSAGLDAVTVSGSSGSFVLSWSGFVLSGLGAAAATDSLTVNLLGGDDVFSAGGLAATSVGLTANGGTGNDVLVGSAGNDTLNGDANDDFVDGNDGADTIDCGANTDVADGGAGIDSAANCETTFNVP